VKLSQKTEKNKTKKLPETAILNPSFNIGTSHNPCSPCPSVIIWQQAKVLPADGWQDSFLDKRKNGKKENVRIQKTELF
jgi:hypothetical protein